jgi:AraC-like DNA-binding protein
MDRHDVPESVTAEDVAQLHQEDLKIQHHFGCRGLTYWFDDKRKTAFCLIEAPTAAAIVKLHNEAHGQVPHRVIEVDPSIVESFLGRLEDPERARDTGLNIINDPAFRTIMVIGIQLVAPPPFKSSQGNFNEAVLQTLHAFEGNPVKQSDFQILVSFKSVSKAVHAAFDLQSRFRGLLKIGLSAGVPVTGKELFFEDTIKSAERMCEIVKGEIILSAEVKALYKSENANTFREGETVITLTPADERFLALLMDYVDSAWSDTNLKVDDFSKPAGCSKSQLYRKMMVLTGQSPNAFIKEYRLKEALKLLNSNAGNISEIAFETGFSSPSYFSKCFQKRYGHLPSEYLQVAEA